MHRGDGEHGTNECVCAHGRAAIADTALESTTHTLYAPPHVNMGMAWWGYGRVRAIIRRIELVFEVA